MIQFLCVITETPMVITMVHSSEMVGAIFSDSDSASVTKFLNPGLTIFQI